MGTVVISNNAATNVLYSLISFGGLWLLVFVFWRSYCIGAFREDLFTLRAQLFDLAADRRVSFTNPYYKYLWGRINSTLRWAPKLNIVHLAVTWVFGFFYRPTTVNPMIDAGLRELPLPTQEKLIAIDNWLLVRTTFQVLHFPAILFGFGQVVWGLREPMCQSKKEILRAISVLEKGRILRAVRLVVEEAVESRKLEMEANVAKA